MNKIYKCFPQGKTKALTMSYDDGRKYDIPLIKIFNKYNIRATFHLNSNIDKDPLSIRKYGKRIDINNNLLSIYKGHEIACHTADHIPLNNCPLTQSIMQIVENRKALENILKYPVRGFSYPYGLYNEKIKDILENLGIEYARTVKVTNNFDLPDDFYEWNGTCRHIDENLMNLCDEFLSINQSNRLNLMYVWGHSYEFERDNNWSLIEDFCRKVGNRNDIWYATNIEIVDYLKAYENLKFSFNGDFVYNPGYKSVWINCNNKIYEIKGGHKINLQ